MTIQRIDSVLNKLKEVGRSSPFGIHWQDFYILLKGHQKPREPNPPVPLILAGSVFSNATKHQRLTNQLEWAMEHDCLEKALKFLEALHPDEWNSAHPLRWGRVGD